MPAPASEDASFRRYFRVQADERSGGASLIVMDAPPPQEDCRPFVSMAAKLQDIGLNSVRVLEADIERGFLLLSDLGRVQYLHALEAYPARAPALYKEAIDALLQMQSGGVRFQSELPLYDELRLRAEMSLFHDWLCKHHLNIEFSKQEEQHWQAGCDLLANSALAQTRVLVHRDYHSRNLMVVDPHNPGILDFQDAVVGPVTYDLVSLLKDCYIKWSRAQIEENARYFYDRSPRVEQQSLQQFMRDFDLMGVQRHLKAVGIFARLLHRDGKAGYMQDVPRALSYVSDVAPQFPELAFLGELIATRVLPGLKSYGSETNGEISS